MKFYPVRSSKKNTVGARGFLRNIRGSGYLLPLIAVMLAVATVATYSWIRTMRETANNGQVTSDDYRLFELGAITNNAGTDRVVSVATTVLDTMSTYGAQIYGRNTLVTSSDKEGVLCALETSDGNALRPGSSGTLRFRILPRTNNHDYYATFSMEGIKKVVDTMTSTVTYRMLDRTDPDEALVLNLLSGHLLLFSDSAHTTRIDDDNILLIDNANTANSEYIVTIYWEWPRTYTQHSAFVDSAWRSTHTYLDSGTGDVGYNNADQTIGEHVSFVVIELNVTGTLSDTSATQRTVQTTLINNA